jgi:hypothetical protein
MTVACCASPAALPAGILELIVIGPVALTTCIGAISYLWLTAVMLPLSMGLRATSQVWSGNGWRSALPITLGIAALTAAIPTAGIVILTMTVPSTAYVLDSACLPVGLLIGATVWGARAIAVGVPRLSADVEMALALAVVALKTDEVATLSAVERRYGQYVLRTVPQTGRVEQLQPV